MSNKTNSLSMDFNLICIHGHKHWAAEPMVFVDSECHTTITGGQKCHEPLMLIRVFEKIQKEEKKSGVKTKTVAVPRERGQGKPGARKVKRYIPRV